MKGRKKFNFIVIRSFTLKVLSVVFVCLILLACSFGGDKALGAVFFGGNRKLPIYCTENDNRQVAITFDAAWGSDKTEKIVEILNENDITATFFLVGMWVDSNENLTKMLSDEGFEIGTHSNTHPDMTKLSVSQMELELKESVKKIEKVTNKQVTLFRPPYGAYNNNLISVCENLNLQAIQWDVDSLDWKGISASTITSNIIKKVGSGSIILCHNNADFIVEALPSIISTLKSRGFEFVKVSDLLLKGEFKIDNTGRQIKM